MRFYIYLLGVIVIKKIGKLTKDRGVKMVKLSESNGLKKINKKRSGIFNLRSLVVKLAALFLLLIILAWAGYEQYATGVDRANVVMMRDSVEKLKNRFEVSDPKQVWHDQSSCEVSQASSIGEDTRYFCNARYTMSYLVSNQESVDKLVGVISDTVNNSSDILYDINNSAIGNINLAIGGVDNVYYNSINFKIKDVKTNSGGCDIIFVISEKKDSIDLDIKCSVSTKKAYFEPIRYI